MTVTAVRHDDATALVKVARALQPLLRERATAAEAAGALPADVVRALEDAGMFSMVLPRDLGGAEASPRTQFEVIEALSHADASAGWCVMIGCDAGYWAGWLEPEAADELLGVAPRTATATIIMPGGVAIPVDGGYQVSGRWALGSGRGHARLVACGVLIQEDGGLRTRPDGSPAFVLAIIPVDQTQTIDTWDTTGLRATASDDFSVEDVFVPQAHVIDFLAPPLREGPAWAVPNWFLGKLSAVALGVGRRALDELASLAHTKTSPPTFTLLSHDPTIQRVVAEGEAALGAARAWQLAVTDELWDVCTSGGIPSLALRGRYRMAITHSVHAAKQVVHAAYEAAGATAVYRSAALDRCMRDVTAMTQHLVAQRRHVPTFGAAMLGVDPNTIFV